MPQMPGAEILKPMDTDDDFKDAAEDADWRGDKAGPSTPLTEKKAKSLRADAAEEGKVEAEADAGADEDAYNAIIMGAGEQAGS